LGAKNNGDNQKAKIRGEKSSELSVFIREAKSRDKKKVYKRVIEDAIREQNDVVKSQVA
jgi:hypothetical protein